jgi:hypothetical protein
MINTNIDLLKHIPLTSCLHIRNSQRNRFFHMFNMYLHQNLNQSPICSTMYLHQNLDQSPIRSTMYLHQNLDQSPIRSTMYLHQNLDQSPIRSTMQLHQNLDQSPIRSICYQQTMKTHCSWFIKITFQGRLPHGLEVQTSTSMLIHGNSWWEMSHSKCNVINMYTCISHNMMQCHGMCII